MENVKERIKSACTKQNLTISKLLMEVNIQSGDFYQALNGKKTFFPKWRKKIADSLGISENELFPEYISKEQ